MTIIRVADLWKNYSQDGQLVPALAGVNFEIAKGEIVALLGKSGSGKTTLLNILAGLDRPSEGKVEVEGQDLLTLSGPELTRLRRLRIGFVFQFFNLLPTLTALENVFLSLELMGSADQGEARAALEAVGLQGKENRYPHQLSGGEQQRVAIARAIVKRPAIILADEPTGNLDNKTGDATLQLLHNRCRESGMTLIMASHSELTRMYADTVLRMVDGIVVKEAGPERRLR